MKKIFIGALLLYSMSTYAVTIDAEHPFLRLGTSEDGKTSVFIGAYEGFTPQLQSTGEVIIRAMKLQNIDVPEHPKGQQVEYVMLADCKNLSVKILPIWEKPKEGSLSIKIYREEGKELEDLIAREIVKQPAVPFKPNSGLWLLVTAGCNFVGMPMQAPKARVKTKIEV